MNLILSSVMFASLATVSVLHVLWAMGSTFPAHDEKTLAMTVAGFRGVTAMPPRGLSFIVAIGLMGLSATPWMFLSKIMPAWVGESAMILTACVFLLRAIAGFTPWWRRHTPEQPFANLDMKYYSPLCAFIGLGFAWLAIGGLA